MKKHGGNNIKRKSGNLKNTIFGEKRGLLKVSKKFQGGKNG